jgi:hypothetical protein
VGDGDEDGDGDAIKRLAGKGSSHPVGTRLGGRSVEPGGTHPAAAAAAAAASAAGPYGLCKLLIDDGVAVGVVVVVVAVCDEDGPPVDT